MSTKDIKLNVCKQNKNSKKGEKIHTIKVMEEFTSKIIQPTLFTQHLKHMLYVIICCVQMFFLAFHNTRICIYEYFKYDFNKNFEIKKKKLTLRTLSDLCKVTQPRDVSAGSRIQLLYSCLRNLFFKSSMPEQRPRPPPKKTVPKIAFKL